MRRIKKSFLILLLARAIDRAYSPFIPGLKRQRGFLPNQIKESIDTFASWKKHWDTEGRNAIVDNPLFKQIMTPSFWDNPLAVCYEALNALVQTIELKKK